jgi:polar amino acid transport system substrate-binding protein
MMLSPRPGTQWIMYQYLNYSQPYLQSSIHFIKRKDTPFEYTRFEDLEKMTINVVGNYVYEEGFNEATGVEKITTSSLTENMRMLIDRKVDLTLDDERVLRYAINQSMPQSMAALVILVKPLAMRGINIGVSRKNPTMR